MLTRAIADLQPSIKKCLFIAAGLLFFSSIAVPHGFSYDCFSLSPSFSGDQTPYDEINSRKLTRSEQKMLSTLFKSLKGRWQGDAEEIQCIGRADTHSMERFILSITAEGKTDHRGNLKLKVKLRSKTEKTNQTKMFAFDITDNKLRFDHGDVELIEVAENRVRFLYRWRGGGTTGQNRETFIALIAEKNAFSIERRVYSSGKFTFNRILYFRR